MKERLGQLKDLVQYYQSGTEFIHGPEGQQGELPSQPSASDYEDPQLLQNIRYYIN